MYDVQEFEIMVGFRLERLCMFRAILMALVMCVMASAAYGTIYIDTFDHTSAGGVEQYLLLNDPGEAYFDTTDEVLGGERVCSFWENGYPYGGNFRIWDEDKWGDLPAQLYSGDGALIVAINLRYENTTGSWDFSNGDKFVMPCDVIANANDTDIEFRMEVWDTDDVMAECEVTLTDPNTGAVTVDFDFDDFDGINGDIDFSELVFIFMRVEVYDDADIEMDNFYVNAPEPITLSMLGLGGLGLLRRRR